MNDMKKVLVANGLTKRESEVGELVANGLSSREAATILYITEKGVKFHLTSIYKKLNVKTRSQFIILANQLFNSPTMQLFAGELKQELSVQGVDVSVDKPFTESELNTVRQAINKVVPETFEKNN